MSATVLFFKLHGYPGIIVPLERCLLIVGYLQPSKRVTSLAVIIVLATYADGRQTALNRCLPTRASDSSNSFESHFRFVLLAVLTDRGINLPNDNSPTSCRAVGILDLSLAS
jgi:hypothetical protein